MSEPIKRWEFSSKADGAELEYEIWQKEDRLAIQLISSKPNSFARSYILADKDALRFIRNSIDEFLTEQARAGKDTPE